LITTPPFGNKGTAWRNTSEASDLNGQIVNARDGAIRVRAGVPVLSDGR
jgi:hypothetical protein